MTSNTAFPTEQLSEADVQQLQRVYAFLLKRLKQHKATLAGEDSTTVATPPQAKRQVAVPDGGEDYLLEVGSKRLGRRSDA